MAQIQSGTPPNTIALYWARAILGELNSRGLVPQGIVPSSEGGVGYYFASQNRYASLECLNTGEIIGLKKGGHLSGSDIWILNPETLTDEIASIQIFMNR